MNIDKNKVFTLFALTLLIASLVFVNYNVRPIQSKIPVTRYLHKEEPLLPVHLHKEEPLQPVHIHPVGTFDPTKPLNSTWHELYPQHCNYYNLSSWKDTDNSSSLTPSDQIDLTNFDTGEVTWYHLDRVTWTIFIEELVEPPKEPPPPLYAELEMPPGVVPTPIKDPICTHWHVVHPNYSRRFHIWSWNDTGEPYFEFSPSDEIDVQYDDEEPGIIHWYHVMELTTDLILTKKCLYNPVCSQWHELSPNFSQYYHLSDWEDTDEDHKLSPSDQIDLHVDWPKFHHDNALSGYSVSTAPNTNTTLWTYNTSAAVASSPAIVDGKLYIGSNVTLFALNAQTGVSIWNYTTAAPIMSSPAVYYGKVYFLSVDGIIHAVDAATGALVWSVSIGAGPWHWSSPAVHAGRVFIGDSNGWIHCLNAFNGAFIWSTFVGGKPNSPIAVANNKVFSGTHNVANTASPTLVALNELTGAIIWTYNYHLSVPGIAGMVNMNGATVVDGDGDGNLEVYFGICAWNITTGAKVVGEAIALWESNGALKWRYTFLNVIGAGTDGPGWSTSTPAVHGGKVFIGSDDQNIYALNAATGAKIWNYTTKAAVWSSPAVADGKVFVGSLDHTLYALNENTGALIWSYNTSKSRIWPSPAVACGKVFVGSDNGNVYAFGSEEPAVQSYHVDRVTLTILLKEWYVSEPIQLYAELVFAGPLDVMYRAIMNPLSTRWHVVYPARYHSRRFNITSWGDNGDGVLSFCDIITVLYDGEVQPRWYHVEEIACDIILTKKCFYEPVCTQWHELYPSFSNRYHLSDWEDTDLNDMLSRSDQINLTNKVTGDVMEYHVDNVTLTMNITEIGVPAPPRLFAEFKGPFRMFFEPIMNAVCTDWHVVYPPQNFSKTFHVWAWIDNGDGVLSFCDEIDVLYEDEKKRSYHVEELACDIVVTEKVVPVHDVAVVSVASRLAWVYQGQVDPIDVTVRNEGDFNETVAVYAFYDGYQAAPPQTTTLNVGETKTLTFNWNTAGVPYGFYTVSANATIAIDNDPGDNRATGNVQEVRELPPPPPLPREADLELRPREVVDLYDPYIVSTQWHELHPSKTNYYHLTSWEPGRVLSPEDWVWMDGLTFEVDDVTIDLVVRDLASGITYWLDYECGYWTFDPKEPVCTKWHEIKNSITHEPPIPPRCWHLKYWYDDSQDGELSYCDTVNMTMMYPYGPYWSLFHVEKVTVTLKLTEVEAITPVQYYLEFLGTLQDFKAMDCIHYPWGTPWLEIWPVQGRTWTLTNWMDRPFLSPSDQILLTLKDPVTHEPIPGAEAWYHVDKLTVAMNLTRTLEETHIVKFEGSLQQFKKYHWRDPFGTQWHEVNPIYCRQWYLWDWMDMTGDGYLGPGDVIFMMDKKTGDILDFYVESLSTDMWVTQKICGVDITSVVPWFKNRVINGVYRAWTDPANPVQVLVTVHNNGTLPLNCTVNVYCFNATVTYLIGTQNVSNLPSCNTITLTFRWNVAVLKAKNTYTLKANATCPCTASDEFINGNVKVRLWGDVDDSGAIDILDLKKVKLAFSGYIDEPFADLDGDCDVDILDLKKEKLILSGFISPYGP